MPIVNPTPEHIEDFERNAPDDAPIVMVNLLKFRDIAAYADVASERISGRKAYARYSKAVLPLLLEIGGQPLWMGKVRAGVIIPEGEVWDEVLLVHYPSRRAFVRMVRSDAYQAIMPHRTAALEDSRLIETQALPLPRWLLAPARAAMRLKALVWPAIRR